jgi:hypothetical protein
MEVVHRLRSCLLKGLCSLSSGSNTDHHEADTGYERDNAQNR